MLAEIILQKVNRPKNTHVVFQKLFLFINFCFSELKKSKVISAKYIFNSNFFQFERLQCICVILFTSSRQTPLALMQSLPLHVANTNSFKFSSCSV